MQLNHKVALVTGAGTSIGRELARAFAAAGARVACCGRRLELLQDTVDEIEADGGQGVAVAADITDARQVKALVQQVEETLGPIDLLFNNAGSFRSVAAVWDADPETWWQDVTTNLLGSMLCCQAVLPGMMARDSGVIFNMDGGGGAHGPNIGGSAYGCSKAALLRFSEGLARELEQVGSQVLVLCLNPGLVESDMTRNIAASPDGERWQPFVRQMLERGETHAAGDCAQAALRLLAIADASLNGCTFSVDTDFSAVERLKPRIRAEQRFILRMRTEG